MSFKEKIEAFKKRKKIEKIKKNPKFIMKEKNQNEELQIEAVNHYDYIIRYFNFMVFNNKIARSAFLVARL